MSSSIANETKTLRIFLTRGIIAIAWAVIFATVANSLTAGVTLGAGILLIAYPLIDAVASALDARTQRGTAQRLLLINTGTSIIAAIALGIAATSGVPTVLAVFGVWALVSGGAQLVVVLRRRAQLGNQWPLLLADGVSVIGGIAFILAAAVGEPKLSMLAIYAATGGVEFTLQAWLIARRRRRLNSAAPVPSAA